MKTMTMTWRALLGTSLWLAACGTPDNDQMTSTSSPNTTNDDADTGGTSMVTMTSGITIDPTNAMTSEGSGMMEGSTGADGESGVVFLVEPDGGGISFECDIFAQDCPPGEKCMPWSNDGGTWNATRCSPVAMNPGQPGDDCAVEGSAVSGIDDCDLGAQCWDVDPETNMGTCVAMCTGDEANPICEDPDTTCSIANDGAIVLCLPVCDPLLQDCPMGNACYPVAEDWVCGPDASGEMGAYGDPCEFINVCDPGLVCLGAAAVPPGEACEGAAGCCTEVCDVTDPTGDAQCSGQAGGQTCQAWYDPMSVPPGYEDVGVCALPA
ncbi:ribulose phosphate epimerase [Paraliomyxa miuraensis]|uniref:ribulose phosphate epimerase n=1 Tax=Paraliomyxa miuraensis TaxID=376150 RepID=UPI00224C8BA4|nr:ribulose phosphate epimerase [Paraliomyxa miuraensis]MCX4242328.1 ribulose phosphate epimerase [Paraliomyxa miuraensis]